MNTVLPKLISFVVPVCNESATIVKLTADVNFICGEHGYAYELVFVDDGSFDNTWALICQEARHNKSVRGLRLARNFGKAAALTAGFGAIRGDVVFTLDGDLQDDPAEIPHFISKLSEGFDLVCGWKKRRYDPLHKVMSSRLFNIIVSTITRVKLHDHNCGYKCFRRDVVAGVRLYGQLHRFIPILSAARGWRIGEIVVNHRSRKFGSSKYGWSRTYKGFFDLLTIIGLTVFRQSPMHLFGGLGAFGMVLGGGALTYLSALWVLGEKIGHRPLMIYAFAALILGFQMFALGLIAELITAYLIQAKEIYYVAEQTSQVKNTNVSNEYLTVENSFLPINLEREKLDC